MSTPSTRNTQTSSSDDRRFECREPCQPDAIGKMDAGIFPVSPCGSTKWQSSVQPVRPCTTTSAKGSNTMNEERFNGLKDVGIFFRSWHPDAKPRAVVAICHGLNAHSGEYLRVGNQLQAAGFAVYALDLRGRGKSDGERFYVDDLADYVSDV